MAEGFTERPWRFQTTADGATLICSQDGTCIAETFGPKRYEDGNLIAAAPDLHMACDLAVSWLEGDRDAYQTQGLVGPDFDRLTLIIDLMRKAFAKAATGDK